MTLSLSQVIAKIRSMERIVLVMAALTIAALLYAGNLGVQWWSDSARAAELDLQAAQLRVAVDRITSEGSLTATLAEQQAALERETARFSYASDDEVIGLVALVARDARVQVGSVGTQEGAPRIEGPMTYRVRVLDVRLNGHITRLLEFVDALSSSVPGTSFSDVRLGGLTESASMTVLIEFLLDPTPATSTEEASA
jgi:hypothetical protein